MTTIGERLTLAIVPRQRWSLSVSSLDATLEHTPEGTALVYVDGGSPADIAAELRRRVEHYGGTYIRVDCVLSPNEARNLAIAQCDREYVIIHDNDVFPRDKWAENLVVCADETGAAMVAPTVLHGPTVTTDEIHIAGGEIHITEDRVMDRNTREYSHTKMADLPVKLERRPTSQIEFHSCLVRNDILQQIAPLDEEIFSMADHEDVTMAISDAGGTLYYEPEAVVVYVLMAVVERFEWGYWQLRWSNEWNSRSFDRFCEKWDIKRDQGWPEWAELWATRERTWWYHRQNLAMTWLGKGLRFASRSKITSRPVSALEELVVRQGRSERRRRIAVLGHA